MQIEGKGNGIKTVVPNMAEIAKALNRLPSYPTKYFGSELGAQVICDDRSNRYIVSGAHEAARLQELLFSFIDKYVLCPECQNPETNLYVATDDLICAVCKACGEKKLVDNRHKLAAHILKTAPPLKKSTLSSGKRKTKKGEEGQGDLADDLSESLERCADIGDSKGKTLPRFVTLFCARSV